MGERVFMNRLRKHSVDHISGDGKNDSSAIAIKGKEQYVT